MDEAGLHFHIAQADYFGTLATVLDLLGQALEARGYRDADADLLRKLSQELVYLQTHYSIRREGDDD